MKRAGTGSGTTNVPPSLSVGRSDCRSPGPQTPASHQRFMVGVEVEVPRGWSEQPLRSSISKMPTNSPPAQSGHRFMKVAGSWLWRWPVRARKKIATPDSKPMMTSMTATMMSMVSIASIWIPRRSEEDRAERPNPEPAEFPGALLPPMSAVTLPVLPSSLRGSPRSSLRIWWNRSG